MRTSIPSEDVLGFIEQLGADPNEVAFVEIDPHRVTVTEYRREEDGKRFAVGDDAAKVRTDIRVERNG